MAVAGKVAALLAALCALGVYRSRAAIAARPRTVQSRELLATAPGGGEFQFKIIERSDQSSDTPRSVIHGICQPHASGAFKGRSCSPPAHVHHLNDEEFTILEGTMGYWADGKEGQLAAGESAFLPRGVPHTFWNAEEDKKLVQEIKVFNDAGTHTASDRFFEQWAGLAYDHGGINNVNPLQLLLTLNYGDMDLALPLPAKLLIKHAVLPLARLLGFKGMYPQYVLP